MAEAQKLVLVQIVRVPAAGVADFQLYESRVLPLLPKYGGRLERRLRGENGRFELHVISFPSADAVDRYRADPERQAQLPLLARSGAQTELIEVAEAL
jgi:uncharacterized protein (DUF1330 family)